MSVKKPEDKLYNIELTCDECATIFSALMTSAPRLPEPERSKCLSLSIKFMFGVIEK